MKFKDFQGFRFGNIHSSDLHLEVVSSSNRYEGRVLPNPNDITTDIPGSDGQYYFGSTYKNREISVNIAFDNISEEDYRKIRQLFATDKLQDLVFDEEPYKTWKAKLKAKPEIKFICFTDRETGKRVYKGNGKLQFICYFPYAFGFDKYIVRAADYYMLNPPETILCEISNNDDNIFINSFDTPAPMDWLPQDIKYHYNTNPSDYEGGQYGQVERDDEHKNKTETINGIEINYRDWNPNDSVIWKGGFPTIDQVQGGELYFDTPYGEKSLIDVRGYWDNIPEWQCAANLLTTPTLDYEQELMYLPQYSKVDFINMELGFQNSRPMIGSRMLVYNPGDIPIDWELKIKQNKKGFWSSRGGERFRIRRFNVERLKIEDAVDFCGLETYLPIDNKIYKYGNKYFVRKILDRKKIEDNVKDLSPIYFDKEKNRYDEEKFISSIRNGHLFADKKWDNNYDYQDWTVPISSKEYNEWRNTIAHLDDLRVAFNLKLNEYGDSIFQDAIKYSSLGAAHPEHCYYAEPIPRQKLDHFIKLFYWQTSQIQNKQIENTHYNNTNEDLKINYEEGIEFANRYRELLDSCIDEQEEYELYWDTLKKLFTKFFKLEDINSDDLFNCFVNNPLEFIRVNDKDLDYGDEVFNAYTYPQWITDDYLEIDSEQLYGVSLIKQYMAAIGEDAQSIFTGQIVKFNPNHQVFKNSQYRSLIVKLKKLLNDGQNINDLLDSYYYLNSETRMLYSTPNPNGQEFNYKPNKNIMNEAIVKGNWFKLPPGWSLISIEPVVEEDLIGQRRWLDARPFDWGYGGDLLGNQKEVSQLYDFIYEKAKIYFMTNFHSIDSNINSVDDSEIQFRKWYMDKIENTSNYFMQQYYFHQMIKDEYQFLSIINDFWQLISPYYAWTATKGVYFDPDARAEDTKLKIDCIEDINGNYTHCINGNISDWWWYACNYIWQNFPPLYWAAADMLNDIKIKYTPLFY